MKRKKTAAYVRASHEDQAKFGHTIPAQKQHLEEYINSNEALVLVDFYVDEGISADKLNKRTELQRLLDDVRDGKIDVIIFTKLDRWFRSVAKYYKIQEVLEANKVSWRAILEDYETVTANGKFKVNIMLSVAQQERDRTSERIKDVFEYKIKNGEAILPHNTTPFGFAISEEDGTRKLVHDPLQEPILQDLIKHYFTFNSKRKAIRYLLEKYGIHMDWTTISKLLNNTLLYGCYRGVEGHCVPYITKEKFDELQEMLRRNIRENKTSHVYLFSGLVKCPVCGKDNNRHMNGATSIQYYKDSTYIQRVYRCDNKHIKRTCTFGSTINEKVVEKQVLEKVKPMLEKRIFEYESTAEKQEIIIDEVKQIQKEIDRLNNMYQKGRLDEDTYDFRYDQLDMKLQQANNRKRARKDVSNIKELIDGNFFDAYVDLTREEKQSVWRGIIRELYFDENKNLVDIDFI